VAEPEAKPARYVVKVTAAAYRDIESLTKKISKAQRKRIGQKIHGLASEPRPVGSKKLTDNGYRLRDGNYRILYEIDDKDHTVRIGRIQDRSNVYRKRS